MTYRITQTQSEKRPIVLACLGDIQWTGPKGTTACDLLKRHIDRILELNAYVIGTGDAIDFLSPSNRQRMQAAALYESALDVVEDKALELTHELYENYLKPLTGRFVGWVEGHHFVQLRSGETTDQRLCQLLGAKFLGTAAFIRFQFEIWGTRSNVVVWVHHGAGGGGKVAAPLNKLENLMPYWDADIYIVGHLSKLVSAPIDRIVPRWHGHGAPDLIHKRAYLIGAGSFSRGYVHRAMEGRVPRDGYVGKRMLNPVALGAPFIYITPNQKTLTDAETEKLGIRTSRNPHHWSYSLRVEV